MRQFNYGFVGEYGQSQPVWVSARDTQGELVGGLRGFVFLEWLNVELLFVDDLTRTVSETAIPLSIPIALIGAPFFAVLLRRTKQGWME